MQLFLIFLLVACLLLAFAPLGKLLRDYRRQMRLLRSGRPLRVTATGDVTQFEAILDGSDVESVLDFSGKLVEALRREGSGRLRFHVEPR